MRATLSLVSRTALIALMACGAVALAAGSASAADCLLCKSDSTGKCEGAKQCKGSRDHCKKIGCKIGGTASCSTAANVKICSDATHPEDAPMMSLPTRDVSAESFQECLRQGCSSDDCAAATQNGFTCKSWKCFKGCLSGKGFRGSCHDHAGNPDRFAACKRANDACEGKCKYR